MSIITSLTRREEHFLLTSPTKSTIIKKSRLNLFFTRGVSTSPGLLFQAQRRVKKNLGIRESGASCDSVDDLEFSECVSTNRAFTTEKYLSPTHWRCEDVRTSLSSIRVVDLSSYTPSSLTISESVRYS